MYTIGGEDKIVCFLTGARKEERIIEGVTRRLFNKKVGFSEIWYLMWCRGRKCRRAGG